MSKLHLKYGGVLALCGNHYYTDVITFVNAPANERCRRCSYLLLRHGYSIEGLKQRYNAALRFR